MGGHPSPGLKNDVWVTRSMGREAKGVGGEDVDLVSLEVQKALKGVRKMSQSPESQRTERNPVRDEEEESIEVERVPSRAGYE